MIIMWPNPSSSSTFMPLTTTATGPTFSSMRFPELVGEGILDLDGIGIEGLAKKNWARSNSLVAVASLCWQLSRSNLSQDFAVHVVVDFGKQHSLPVAVVGPSASGRWSRWRESKSLGDVASQES